MTGAEEFAFRAVGPEGPSKEAIRIRVEVPEAGAVVDALYPDYQESVAPGGPDLVLAPLDRGGYGVRGRGKHLGTPTLNEAVTLLEQRLTEELLGSLPGTRVLHGSAVATPQGALLLPGFSGVGKSTLAAGLVSRGFPLFGDDVLLLGLEDRRVHPFKRLLKVDERGAEILDLDPPAGPLRSLWPDRCIFHPRDLGSEWAAPAPVALVVLPRREEHKEGEREAGPALPRLDPVSGGEAMKEILEQLLLVDRVGADEFLAAADALADARLFELRYGRSDRAVEILATESA